MGHGAVGQGADALLLPYREASQSGVAAAALAAGRGAIGTRVGGLAEQLSAAPRAILCEPTPESLAEAITRYIAAPPPPVPPVDPVAAWRDMARDLLAATITAR